MAKGKNWWSRHKFKGLCHLFETGPNVILSRDTDRTIHYQHSHGILKLLLISMSHILHFTIYVYLTSNLREMMTFGNRRPLENGDLVANL